VCKSDWITMSLFIRIFYLLNCSTEAGETLYHKCTPEVVENLLLIPVRSLTPALQEAHISTT
jgi:hypothetical protein